MLHWKFVVFVMTIPLLAIQSVYAQSGKSDPLCEFACWMSPEDAPASCACKASEGGIFTQPPATPAEKPSAVPAPVPPQAQAKPEVSNCQVICQKNPATAPASCNCALSQGGGTGSAGGGMSPKVTPKSIAEDGLVSVAELLDYMEQLYRSRIAGVQRYQFLERKVAGQSEPLSRSESEPRVIPVANTQLVQNKPIMGVDTMIPGMYFLEKVMREGHEAFKILTPPELAARRDLSPPPGSKKPRYFEAGKAVQKDPAMLLEALGLKGTAKDMRDQVEQEKNDEDLFAEDVLEELLALKKAIDEETVMALSTKNREQMKKLPTLKIGWVPRDTLKFTYSGSYCKSPLGCTLTEIFARVPKDWTRYQICLIWTPKRGSFALSSFSFKQGINSKNMWASLWLPIPVAALIGDPMAGGNERNQLISTEEGDVDRPIRSIVAFENADGPDKVAIWDRVYGDFRTIKNKGEGPEMHVPHRIREQLRSAPCPGSVDSDYVFNMVAFPGGDVAFEGGDPDEIKQMMHDVMAGKASQEDVCIAALHTAKLLVTDRIREKFQVNLPIPSAAEEARMIHEEFGCLGQTSNDPNSPCYGK